MAQAQGVVGVPVPVSDPVAQISQRLQDQQQRIDTALRTVRITPAQASRDEKTLTAVSNHMSKDEAKQGGTLNPFEQAQLNKRLDKNSHHLKHQLAQPNVLVPVVTPVPQASALP